MTRAWLAGLALVALARVALAGCGDAMGDRPVYLSVDVARAVVLRVRLGALRRADAWARADLDPLIEGLKARGLCFATLREHPQYRPQFSW